MTDGTAASLAGTHLKPGHISISSAEQEELFGVLGSPQRDTDELHPLYGHIATQRGIGTSVEELCDLAGFTLSDGAIMGSIDLEFHAPMHPDTPYCVQGQILDIVRKQSRSLGEFDLMTYQEQLLTEDGTPIATATNTFILPR